MQPQSRQHLNLTPAALATRLIPLPSPRACPKTSSSGRVASKGQSSWSLPNGYLLPRQSEFLSLGGASHPSTPGKRLPGPRPEARGTRGQVLAKQPENPAVRPLMYTYRLGSPTPGPRPPGTPKSQRSSEELHSSQPHQQHPSHFSSICSTAPLSNCQVTCHRQPSDPSPRDAMQSPTSCMPTCRCQDAGEDCVLVFNMAMGNTRMGAAVPGPHGLTGGTGGAPALPPSHLCP